VVAHLSSPKSSGIVLNDRFKLRNVPTAGRSIQNLLLKMLSVTRLPSVRGVYRLCGFGDDGEVAHVGFLKVSNSVGREVAVEDCRLVDIVGDLAHGHVGDAAVAEGCAGLDEVEGTLGFCRT
jgi:hypothetical protein